MGTFTLDLEKFANKVGGKTNRVLRRIAYDAFSRVILKTPVDTGRARANWIPQVGSAATTTVESTDKTGAATRAKVKSASVQFIPGTVFYLSNNLPYIRRLEYDGWSKQAPSGMVGVTMVEMNSILNTALREDK